MKVVVKLVNQNLVSEIPIEANGSLVIGRSSRVGCKVIDQLVSASHCVLELKNNKLEVTDLHSKNGTYINGIRIEQSDIFIGDEIRVGQTKLTLAEDKMETAAIDALSFPGIARNHVPHELKLDFTGLRKAANPYFYTDIRSPDLQLQREVSARKIAQSRIKLSKHEIKKRNQVRSTMASTIDILLCFGVFAIPLFIINILMMIHPDFYAENRLITVTLTEMISIGMFFLLNFKLMKFTLGEKFSGIEKIYRQQT